MLERSQKYMQTLGEIAGTPRALLDGELRVLTLNASFGRLFGTQGARAGAPLSEAIGDALDAGRVRDLVEAARVRDAEPKHATLPPARGGARPLVLTARQLHMDEHRCWVVLSASVESDSGDEP